MKLSQLALSTIFGISSLAQVASAGAEGWSWTNTEFVAREAFSPSVSKYVANIAECESTNRPGARSPYGYVGLLQIDPGLHQVRADRLLAQGVVPTNDLMDPITNIFVAADIQKEQGWGAWPVCSRH